MKKKTFPVVVTLGAIVVLWAAGAGAKAGPSAGTSAVTAPPARASAGPGGLVQWFRSAGENCYLVYSNFGAFGGANYQANYGFHFNVGSYFPPERFEGQFSWTDAPSLANYDNNVESTTTSPYIVLPASASTITVEYQAKWCIELNYDGVELELSTRADPATWHNLHPTSAVLGSGQLGQPDSTRYYYEGDSVSWKKETVDISAFRGDSVRLRLHFRSDYDNVGCFHGLYLDDVKVWQDGATLLYADGFENSPQTDWETGVLRGADVDRWGPCEALLAELNLLTNGQFMAGPSPSYVADAFTPDWIPAEGSYDNLVHYVNASPQPIDIPQMRVEQFLYPYTDFVIVDCYVKNGRPETLGGVYGGVLMDVDIKHAPVERADDDCVQYNSTYDLAYFFDVGQKDAPTCGVMYLGNGANRASSVNFVNLPQYTADAVNYGLMSDGEHDYNGVPSSPNRWAVAVGKGPFTLNQSEGFRFTFAVVGGNNEADLLANADLARRIYANLEDHTPIRVAPSSLGRIKALYR